MIIIPAIDIYEGNVVRLERGEYSKIKIYSKNPMEFAKELERKGATYLHIVDLNGARDGRLYNFEIIKEIIENTSLKIEVGGGIRDLESILSYLELGIDKVILGTKVFTNFEFLEDLGKDVLSRVAVGIDLKNGKIAINGWRDDVEADVYETIDRLKKTGISRIIITDIGKDGLLSGTNLSLYEELSTMRDIEIVASGGITDYEEIHKLKEIGLYGAIIGKAMYEGLIDIEKAIKI